MSDESRYRAGASGGADEQGGSAAQPARVPERSHDDGAVEEPDERQLFILGGNALMLAAISSLQRGASIVTARTIPLAWTPLGPVVGAGAQDVGVAVSGLYDWIDRTFPIEDEHAFVTSMRDVELLTRIGWDSGFPEKLDEATVINLEDLPDELANALARAPEPLVACAICRRLCVRGEFVWKEKHLCAWDFHAQVFGKRGPWREGPYEERHFATLPECAYVAADLLTELGVEVALSIGAIGDAEAQGLVNALLATAPSRPYMAVKTEAALTVLRER